VRVPVVAIARGIQERRLFAIQCEAVAGEDAGVEVEESLLGAGDLRVPGSEEDGVALVDYIAVTVRDEAGEPDR
jgi:hypothetical protein